MSWELSAPALLRNRVQVEFESAASAVPKPDKTVLTSLPRELPELQAAGYMQAVPAEEQTVWTVMHTELWAGSHYRIPVSELRCRWLLTRNRQTRHLLQGLR